MPTSSPFEHLESRFLAIVPPDFAEDLTLTEPTSEKDWEKYFDLRWRILRAPWKQPKGSERDDLEENAYHLTLKDRAGAPIAIGRLHLNCPKEAQVRFMAVEPAWQKRGLGSRILRQLEAEARARRAQVVVLNARRGAQPFYARHGYSLVGPAPTLFDDIHHVRMQKVLIDK